MQLTDLFIKRPVLATVISLTILVLGIRSIFSMPIRQYPYTENSVVTISTGFTGADPETIAGYITTPMETSVAQAGGIDYMTSISDQGVSIVSVNLKLNYDPMKALADITTKVNAILSQLPKGSLPPIISVQVGETIDAMYMGFYSDVLPLNKITDYLIRVVQPKLQTISGVQQAEILGGQTFALRAWLDPVKLAGYHLAPQDISLALAANDFVTVAGRTDGDMFIRNLTANTDLSQVEDFRNMIVKQQNGAIIRLGDVARVELGAQNYDSTVSFDGRTAVYVGIKVAPSGNLLSVISDVKKLFPTIQEQLPAGLQGRIVYDASAFVSSSIHEVVRSLLEAFIIVAAVIYLFLGSFHAVLVPLVAIPLSLIGTFFIMLGFGYSINLLTLLALVLAIGLVVDDAIIVVENVQRHMEEGKTRLEAALMGARELVSPIIATTVVLIAVYVPIGFMGGLTGTLFTEFAFSLAGAVTISAIIALTLSPMMCSKLLTTSKEEKKFWLIEKADKFFLNLEQAYARNLQKALRNLPVVMVFAIIILLSNYFLFVMSSSELAPQEDQGIIIASVFVPPNASLAQSQLYDNQVSKIFASYPETDHIFQIDNVGSGIIGMVLKPWDQRSHTTNQLQNEIQGKLNQIAGAQVAAFQLPSLPGGNSGLPIQFVLTTTESFQNLNVVLNKVMDEARSSGMFAFINPDLKIDKLQTTIQLDRDKASLLGLDMQSLANTLIASLSQGYINYFNYAGRSYQVIPQMKRNDRLNPDQVLDYYITPVNGDPVALSTVASLKNEIVPESLNHFQQLNSATITAVAFPGITMGQAIDKLNAIAKNILPEGFYIDYAAQSRQYIQEGSAIIMTFFFAMIIIFLSLAALFESFRDPFIILISVPMSICGAMIFICLGIGHATLNIYSEVGLVTLIGLISKNGILIVQFANDLQLEGKNKLEAVRAAAAIRLRPILMTSISMVLGVVPLILATGAGAESRFNIGLVIASGIAIGTLFTLFVVPAMYMILADDLQKKKSADDLESIIE